MAYIKNTWTTGDVVTAEKLNHIENGIENAIVTAGYILHPVVHEFEGSIYAKLSPDAEPVGLPGGDLYFRGADRYIHLRF